MKTAVVIPARYGSSRLPGKPLLRQTGKYLVQHVFEQVCKTRGTDAVIVATDDSRILAAVESFGGRAVLTRRDHASGTDRVAEVARRLDADVIVNVQGDEPLVEPGALELLIGLMAKDVAADMATLAAPLGSLEAWLDPNCVKVVCDAFGRALYFSRSPIPFVRDGSPSFTERPSRFLQHLGVYAYRRSFLLSLAELPPEPLEQFEKLEQLRVLALGRRIQVGVVEHNARGVDTYDDYLHFVDSCRRRRLDLAA
jgi:3-deoxy-manno-octulosonate cytidylyltransferase (CMP-KDO synthetase)